MPFNNPIVAGDTLIRAAIESENFSDIEPGTGWQISRDGTATFNSLSTRGDASGDTASYDTVSATSSLLYRGDELEDLLTPLGGQALAFGFLTASSATNTSGIETGIMRLSAPIEHGRGILIRAAMGIFSNPAGHATILIRYTEDGSEPTFSSTILKQTNIATTSGAFVNEVAISRYHLNGLSVGTTGTIKLLLTFTGNIAAGSYGIFATSSYPIDVTVHDAGPTAPLTGVVDTGAANPPKSFKSFQLTATNSVTFYGDGTQRTDSAFRFQGQTPFFTPNGNQFSYLEWNSATDIVGVARADIAYLDVYIRFDHWHSSAGGTAVLGSSGTLGEFNNVQQIGWEGRGIGKWISILTMSNTALFDQIVAGGTWSVKLGPGLSTSTIYYGYARGHTMADPPLLRAGYYK